MSVGLWIVKTGRTTDALRERRGDFEDWILEGMGESRASAEVVDVEAGAALPAASAVGAVVVTGSSALVTDRLDWSVRTGEWLRAVVQEDRPVLGICYGHQLLAESLGGEVAANPHGREIGAIDIQLEPAASSDPLFGALGDALRVSSSHRQHVARLPPGAARLGGNDADPHQVVRYAPKAWGVQFHPEWDDDVIRAYLEARREVLAGEGIDADQLLAEVAPSPHGEQLLRRFRALAG